MKIILREARTGDATEALIVKAGTKDMPLKKDGWNFTWRSLSKTEGAMLYKLITVDNPERLQGMLMLTLIDEEMLFMNNIEVSPSNYRSEGKFENVAGGLIAYACYKSFELGKQHYLGYLTFDSKTKLIELYQNKYGATFAMGQKMFFDPQAGKALMKKYLSLNLEEE